MSKSRTHTRPFGRSWSVSERVLGVLPERDDPTWYVVGVAAVLFVGFSIYTSMLHARFATTGADLGAYTHMFATTLRGEGWLLNGKYRVSLPTGSYWGAHFSLTLLFFLPFFALIPSVYTLLVVKSFVLAGSIVVLWLLAREHLDTRVAGVVTASYAFNPFLWSAWSFDFQEQILIPPLLFAAYYAYLKERRVAFLALLALVLFTNEFVIFVVLGLLGGLVLAAVIDGDLRRKAPLIAGAFGLVVVARVVSSVVIDHFSRLSGLPTYVVARPLHPFIDAERVGIGELVRIVLANPPLLLESASVSADTKVTFFVALMLPVAFLALFDELSLGALAPYLGFSWIFAGTAKAAYYQFGAHYPLYLLPFVYIGVIHALGRLSSRVDGPLFASLASKGLGSRRPFSSRGGPLPSIPPRQLVLGALVVVLSMNLVAGVVTDGGHLALPPGTDDDHTRTLNAAIDSIPEDASLLTQNDIYPHVAVRPNATFVVHQQTFQQYEERYGTPRPEYILIDSELETKVPWDRQVEISYVDLFGSEYGLYRYQDGIRIFKRGYDGPPMGITRERPGARQYDADELAAGTGEHVRSRIVSQGGSPGDYIWYGPYDTLTPGTYEATFRVDASASHGSPIAVVDVGAGDDHRRIASAPVRSEVGWQNVTVQFTLNETVSHVEFRGIRRDSGRIVLDWVRVAYRPTKATSTADVRPGPNANATAAAAHRRTPTHARMDRRTTDETTLDRPATPRDDAHPTRQITP